MVELVQEELLWYETMLHLLRYRDICVSVFEIPKRIVFCRVPGRASWAICHSFSWSYSITPQSSEYK
jgi:hypothetical protein